MFEIETKFCDKNNLLWIAINKDFIAYIHMHENFLHKYGTEAKGVVSTKYLPRFSHFLIAAIA